MVIDHDRVLDRHDGPPTEPKHEQLVEVVHERGVARADRRQLDDLAADQLDPVGGLEDAASAIR